MPRRIEMVGQKYGRLVVLADRDADGALLGTPACRAVVVACDCGREKIVAARSLRKGHATSCGCAQRDAATKHGLSDRQLYGVWNSMIARCGRPNSASFAHYGARGIKVCAEWAAGPAAFFAWAEAAGYASGLQLDRIDTNGNYEPANCRFVSCRENQNNRRSNRIVSIHGSTLTIAEASRQYGIPPDRLRQRIVKLGWAPELAVSRP